MNNVTHRKCKVNEHIKNVHGGDTNGCDDCDNIIPGGQQMKNT